MSKKSTSAAASEFGKVGGNATLAKHGSKHYSDIAKKRWSKKQDQSEK
jgi:hypothetical protein